MDLANDSMLVTLPGKDPDRIQKDHPTIVFFDEAAIIERFEESYGVALAAGPLNIRHSSLSLFRLAIDLQRPRKCCSPQRIF